MPLTTALFILANTAAVSLFAFFSMRVTDCSFDPVKVKAGLYALPQWIQVVLTGVLLVLLAVNFDYIGRSIARLLARLFQHGEETPRQLAQLQFVCLLTILATVAVAMVLVPGVFLSPNKSRLLLLLCAAITPILLSVREWRRCR